jgi:hypothetical protein
VRRPGSGHVGRLRRARARHGTGQSVERVMWAERRPRVVALPASWPRPTRARRSARR